MRSIQLLPWRRCLWLLLATLITLSSLSRAPAAIERRSVEAAVADAQELAEAGDLTAADVLLRETLAKCQEGVAGLDCRPLLNYTQGYLREQEARRAPEARARLLEEAGSWYRRVLTDVPGHGKTLANLANVARALGDPNQGVDWLERAVVSDPDERDRYMVAIGDLYREQERWDNALAAYRRAGNWNPESEAPRLGLVETYAQNPGLDLDSLVEQLPAWPDRYPAAAAEGYRLALERAVASGQDEGAERYLLAWVSLLARQGWLTPQRVDDLRLVWPAQPLEELRAYLADPAFAPGWWREGSMRRHTIAQVALAAGQLDLTRLGPAAAEERWQRAIWRLAPRSLKYSHGDLKGRRDARLELQTELAALYHQYPDLDDGNEFQELIWGLFQGKGQAYAANDQAAIQRHHVVLGEIYTQEPGRENPDSYAMNAAFQLHHAIVAADKQFEQGQAYQPLARLKQQLAETCEAPSDVVRREGMRYCEGRHAADRRYLEAAQAYLDSDQLAHAGRMLEKAEGVGLSREAAAAHRELVQVLSTRAAIEGMQESSLRDSRSSALLESSQGAWLRDPSLGHLPDDFTQRQQFKALSDYAAKAEPIAAENAAAAARLEQVKPLLDAAAKGVVLAGTADQLRVAKLAGLDIRYSSAGTCPASADQSLEWVQTGIKRLTAPDLVVDGAYGPKTRRAITDFQSRYGLTADGSLGTRTRAKLRELLCGP